MTTQTRSGPAAGERRLNSPVAFASGAAFVLLGLAGLLVPVSGLTVSGLLHHVLHVAVGAALVAAGILGVRQATLANTGVGVASLALVVIGPAVAGSNPAAPDLLHLLLGLALTAVGVCGDREPH